MNKDNCTSNNYMYCELAKVLAQWKISITMIHIVTYCGHFGDDLGSIAPGCSTSFERPPMVTPDLTEACVFLDIIIVTHTHTHTHTHTQSREMSYTGIPTCHLIKNGSWQLTQAYGLSLPLLYRATSKLRTSQMPNCGMQCKSP